jgi:hypothetical protein
VVVIVSSFQVHSEESGSDDGECENEVFHDVVDLDWLKLKRLNCRVQKGNRQANESDGKNDFFSITHQNPRPDRVESMTQPC